MQICFVDADSHDLQLQQLICRAKLAMVEPGHKKKTKQENIHRKFQTLYLCRQIIVIFVQWGLTFIEVLELFEVTRFPSGGYNPHAF